MAPHVGGTGKESTTALVLGGATAGVLELFTFHPIDTIAKRLMTSKEKPWVSGRADNWSVVNRIIFRDAATKGTLGKYASLFPGLGWAAGYKILQRAYKFGGQPIIVDFLNRNYKGAFQSVFGEKSYKPWLQATAGSLVGIGEVLLLPLDVLKIIKQTNPESVKGRSVMSIFIGEGRNLYRGAGWTAARNAPGSFALFGANAFVKGTVFGLEDYRKATWAQTIASSMAGSFASIVVSAPFDVIKTRIQSQAVGGTKLSGFTVVREMARNEGFGSFFKGLTPKILIVGPKLVFSFTIAQKAVPFFSDLLDSKPAAAKA